MLNKFILALVRLLQIAILSVLTTGHAAETVEPFDMSVEDLLNVQVTSVAKKAQALNDAPAAIFVISNEDIKRSGATNIPDALRLAPGIDVARINASKWAVTARGFNGRFANKLLVLIDGRSAYTRSFAGVYWEDQDVMIEDIDRIEVIRGPGAALWGANAVNGVINIITKHSSETLGGSLNAGAGTQERAFGSYRYGAKLGQETTGRIYVKGFNRDQNTELTGQRAGDDWSKVQGGFRLDSQLNAKDSVSIHGDVYHNDINQRASYPITTLPYSYLENEKNQSYGGNLVGRWQHTLSSKSDYYLQFYYDTYVHNEGSFSDSRHTLDVDFQHRFAIADQHEFIWGLNYRFGHDHLFGRQLPTGSTVFQISPTSVNDQVFSGFLQDEVTLIENKLWLTIGSKFEHNDYSGFEGQPSARIMWAPHHQHRLWAGISRAVRTPTRLEQTYDFLASAFPAPPAPQLPAALTVTHNPTFRSEEVIAYEVGYRSSLVHNLSVDITGFYNDYRDIRYTLQGAPFFNGSFFEVPFQFTNDLRGNSYGVEIASIWQMLDWWRWDVSYSWLNTRINNLPSIKTGISPEQRVSVRAALSPWKNIDFDFWFRYTDSSFAPGTITDTTVKPYATVDLRLAWRPVDPIELSVVGQNLFARKHLEYVQEFQTHPTGIDRGVYGKISWRY